MKKFVFVLAVLIMFNGCTIIHINDANSTAPTPTSKEFTVYYWLTQSAFTVTGKQITVEVRGKMPEGWNGNSLESFLTYVANNYDIDSATRENDNRIYIYIKEARDTKPDNHDELWAVVLEQLRTKSPTIHNICSSHYKRGPDQPISLFK